MSATCVKRFEVEEVRRLFDMKVSLGTDEVRGADVIRLEVGSEGAMTKALNQQIKLIRLSPTGRCLMGQERLVMVERGWIWMGSVEMLMSPASSRMLLGEVVSGASSLLR